MVKGKSQGCENRGNPDLLVLDEPTVGMDVEGRHSFWTRVRELSGHGKTVLFATHTSRRQTLTPTGPC
jgi:ABC-type multidrug transport system ATPase subunit